MPVVTLKMPDSKNAGGKMPNGKNAIVKNARW